MAKEIKQKITLEGEQQYSRAIKEAQRNLKTLKSELKAETAELGKNASEQQKAEARTKSLKQQIAEQEKIVKTLREALDEVKQKYGDNADEVARWEQKLNNARATLGNMRSDLEGVGQDFQSVQHDAAAGVTATKSFADSLGQISDVGSSVSSSIENIFTGMVDVIRDAIADVWADMVDLAGRANAWMDLAGFWNTDAKTIQKWSHAVEGAHNNFEDLNNAVTRINMGDQKKIAEAANVSGVNYSDKWAYATAVMDSLASMDYEHRLEAAGEVFGEKRATKVMDLLNDWNTIKDNLDRFENLGMTQDQIEQMSTLAEKIDLLKETWRAFLDSFEATHLGKLALDLTGNAQRILDDLIKYVDSGDDADLAQLEKDIEDFFERIRVAIEHAAGKLDEAGEKLQESDNGIVKVIGKAMSDLASALEWISNPENIEKVKIGLETLAAIWAAGKVASMISTVAQFAANIKTITAFNALTGATQAAGGAGAAATGLGKTIAGSLASALSGLTLAVAVASLAAPIYNMFKGLIVDGKLPDWVPQFRGGTLGELAGENATPEEKEAFEADAKALGRKAAQTTSGKNLIDWMLGKGTEKPAVENPQAGQFETVGPTSPHVKLNATAAQQAAVEAWWDILRSGDWGENDEKIDGAWDAMEAAFAGNEKVFERLDGLLDRLIEQWGQKQTEKGFNEQDWMDIPASWWQNPAGTGSNENGVTSADLAGFRGLPASMQQAVAKGAASGVSGIKVYLDGSVVGSLVAPYVSAAIAGAISGI